MTATARPGPGEAFIENAPAKVNLSLRVHGRRVDGYHEIESLVVFADIGDVVTLDLGPVLSLDVTGPQATELAQGSNLVLAAAKAASAHDPTLRLGRFRLEKHLPVAAGLGGGSADAAAVLRLLQRANAGRSQQLDWLAIAASIGSDVPVCVGGCAALMRGRGERVTPLSAMPKARLVLANPRVGLSTASVFRALGAPILAAAPPSAMPPLLADIDALLAYLTERPNDLQAAAVALCPAVGHVLDQLGRLDGALMVRMSGSGATCFALFAEASIAEAAATRLAASHPAWWVRAAAIL